MEENSPCVPFRSKPALQNAEIDVNTESQMPFKGPYSEMNTGDIATAPKASKMRHPRKMNLVYFMISPRFGAETASCIVVLA